jgi:Leucine-rich repeat (LRR) protein
LNDNKITVLPVDLAARFPNLNTLVVSRNPLKSVKECAGLIELRKLSAAECEIAEGPCRARFVFCLVCFLGGLGGRLRCAWSSRESECFNHF